jgi:hypothetical protein
LFLKIGVTQIAKTATFDRARLVPDAPFHTHKHCLETGSKSVRQGQFRPPNAVADQPVRTSEEEFPTAATSSLDHRS